ncbi:hypothetical protein [Lentilactobacillus buchneri]|uniref:hypothetical protein n=1 Tax=Lentilactobacillus buchneri TaxID=1581 RepID=UPI001291CECE|nr:hypothetical protein [Lentilactobacillus buchneri]MQM59399.1 hypothetical protein [Lentilactobacillus buchneri]MQM79131.1 hypothetical protein [Lentilactobacillus buchneri]
MATTSIPIIAKRKPITVIFTLFMNPEVIPPLNIPIDNPTSITASENDPIFLDSITVMGNPIFIAAKKKFIKELSSTVKGTRKM